MLWARSLVVVSLEHLLNLVSRALALYMAVFVLALGITYLKGYERYPALTKIVAAEAKVSAPAYRQIQKTVPTQFDGVDVTRWIYIFAIFLTWFLCQLERDRLEDQAMYLDRRKAKKAEEKRAAAESAQRRKAQKKALDEAAAERKKREVEIEAQKRALMAAQAESAAQAAKLKAERVEEAAKAPKFERPEPRPEKSPAESGRSPNLYEGGTPLPVRKAGNNREELLELMAKAKKSLEAQKRSVAFLAIDVADSTGMKVGEDPAIATRDFRKYRQLVEKAVGDHGYLKAAWTPDGVMICFSTVEDAVGAARQLIGDLKEFNASVKAMQRDFKIRCGINAGKVLYDDATPMEEMSDRAIDIAGHMQKYAPVDSIFVGKQALEGSAVMASFKPAQREKIDGCEVYEWKAASDDAIAA